MVIDRISSLSAHSKSAKEGVSKAYYKSISQRPLVSELETTYDCWFEKTIEGLIRARVRRALVEGSGFGVANGIVY